VTKNEIKKHKLDDKFISSCRHSIQHANIIGVLHDVSNFWTRSQLHPMILSFLKEYEKVPSFLILNKIDKLRSKRNLLDLVKTLTCNNISLKSDNKAKKNKDEVEAEEPIEVDKNVEREKKDEGGWPNFKAVFMVSSLNGDGVEKVIDFVESQAIAKPWEFKNNEVTDQKPTEIIQQFVRARLLDYLPQEIPYQLTTELDYYTDENNSIFASVNIFCPSDRIDKLVCGAGDGKLRQITDRVTSDLIQSFQKPVSLTLTTIVKKKIY
jgi:GTPase